MAFASYIETRVLDQLLGNLAGQVNQTITAPAAATTSITVRGSGGSGGLDVAIPNNGIIILATPGTGATQNQYSNVDIVTTNASAAAAATSISIASQTIGKSRAVGDYIFLLGTTSTFAPIVLENTVYVGLSTALVNASVAEPTIGTGNYSRVAMTSAPGNFGATSAGRSVTDGTTTNASPQITSATASFTSGDVGRTVSGTNIPSGSYILTFTNSTTVQLNQNATATGSALTLSFGAVKSNAAVVTFPQSTAAWSTGATNFQSWFLADASTAGNVLMQGALNPVAQGVNAANVTPSFAVNQMQVSLL